MSSTRHTTDDTFHQNKFASSPEFERGLTAYLVARRCSVLDDRADRELIWFIQYLSCQEGGLPAVVKELLALYPDQVRTRAMVSDGIKPGMECNADTVRKIRNNMPGERGVDHFPLYGEFHKEGRVRHIDTVSKVEFDNNVLRDGDLSERMEWSKRHPVSYPADTFFRLCQNAAEEDLEEAISELCLDPASKLDCGPWYFAALGDALRDYHRHWVAEQSRGVAVTELGRQVYEALDYTSAMRIMTLMQGEARRGKTFSAKAWCALHPGRARFVEVPPGNDQGGFYKAIARGLGIGNFLRYKAHEIKERIEAVLLTGDLLICLDESQRLFPQKNLRYSYPERITWLMSMANHDVPICAIATPQFTDFQRMAEENGRWNSAQLTGRISHYSSLPADLSLEDLKAVALSLLPSADTDTLTAMAIYARSSARYLAAIEAIAKRATWLATRDGRTQATTADVRKAMKESVIPSDSRLVKALEAGRKVKSAPVATPTTTVAVAPRDMEGGQADALPAPRRGSVAAPVAGRRNIKPLEMAEA